LKFRDNRPGEAERKGHLSEVSPAARGSFSTLASLPSANRNQGAAIMLKFIGGTIGVIFLIGLLVIIGILALIF
jgi:hypothetical protein